MADKPKLKLPSLQQPPGSESEADRDEANVRLRAELEKRTKAELIEHILGSTLVDRARLRRFLEVFERISNRDKNHKKGTSKGGRNRVEQDPKAKAKNDAMKQIREKFDDWQAGRVKYANDALFAKAMHGDHSGVLVNEGSIKNAITRWRKQSRSS